MRWALLLTFLFTAACGGSASRGPAWPKSQDPETDGGQSLAPVSASSVAAAEDDDEDEDDDEEDAPAAKPAAAKVEEKPATPSSPAPATVDEPTIEEITIEIED